MVSASSLRVEFRNKVRLTSSSLLAVFTESMLCDKTNALFAIGVICPIELSIIFAVATGPFVVFVDIVDVDITAGAAFVVFNIKFCV